MVTKYSSSPSELFVVEIVGLAKINLPLELSILNRVISSPLGNDQVTSFAAENIEIDINNFLKSLNDNNLAINNQHCPRSSVLTLGQRTQSLSNKSF